MKVNYNHTKHTHNPTSANIILPDLFTLVNPKSILDVGCGNGSWLKACKDLGISEVFGVDGKNLPPEDLFIAQNEFKVENLTTPLKLNKTFDLVLSLEVAEHLPESAANTFVDTLTNHGDVILFSAAIPNQGGQFHINEQWPEYWNKKFREKDFQAYDILRSKFWNNDDVLWWYQQNMVVYVKNGDLRFNDYEPSREVLSLIHPKLFNKKVFKPKFMNTKKEVYKSILNSIKYLIKN